LIQEITLGQNPWQEEGKVVVEILINTVKILHEVIF